MGELVLPELFIMGLVAAATFGVALTLIRERRESRRDQFEHMKWESELDLRKMEIDKGVNKSNDDVTESDQSNSNKSSNGYVFVDVPDEYKGLFHDTLRGFEEYARIKGYQVSLAIDTSIPNKIGFRFTIADQGVVPSTEKVRSDVDEYLAKFREDDDLENLPIVVDPVEHAKLKAAISSRFTLVKNNAEMHQAKVDFYRNLALEMKQLHAEKGVFYKPAMLAPTIIHNQLDQGGPSMARDTFTTNQSPGAAIGSGNEATIRESTINIGSSLSERNERIQELEELIELVKSSTLKNHENVARQLENAREELIETSDPDGSLVERFMNKAKKSLLLVEKGTDLFNKAQEVFSKFNIG